MGFFFFPVAAIHELISMGKCSEMDIVLDLWVRAIYNNGQVQDKEYLSLVSFTGRHGNIIYLCSYLPTMFNISDVMIDKEEISMTFQIPVHVPEASYLPEAEPIREEQITIMEEANSVSEQVACVSKPHMKKVVQKVAQILAAQGVSCCECPRALHKLYPLSDCKETIVKHSLQIACPTDLS